MKKALAKLVEGMAKRNADLAIKKRFFRTRSASICQLADELSLSRSSISQTDETLGAVINESLSFILDKKQLSFSKRWSSHQLFSSYILQAKRH